jgi:AhpD family alkylhydroperoxidase
VTGARIAPGGRRDVGLFTFALSRVAGRVAGTAPLNLFLTLGRHRKLFRRWLWFAGGLMPGGILRRRESELVILRVAHLRGCRYELEHHLRLGRRAGLDDGDLARVAEGSQAAGWGPRERALLAAVEALHRDGDLDDDAWTQLRRELDEREAIELCLLAGHYEMLATTIAALRIEPDARRSRVRLR